ncbi:MAG: hypothetical protein K2X98_00560, partial [Alphaproteobacteria bacterium]|nr:hypothetical protein [Alphaproteobacteria bacterium]
MESNFFNYLLKHLRDQQISAHYSMPVKASYPGCELDHKETQVFSGKEVLAFNVIVYFDVLSQQSILDYVQKVEG